MSIAKSVCENLNATGSLLIPDGQRAVIRNYGESGKNIAIIFSDGSEINFAQNSLAIQSAYWTQAGESEFTLAN